MDKKQAYTKLLINSKNILESYTEEDKHTSSYIEARRIYYLTFAGILRSNIKKEKDEKQIKITIDDVEYVAEINLIKQIMGNSYNLIEFINSENNIEQNTIQEESSQKPIEVETNMVKNDYKTNQNEERVQEEPREEKRVPNRNSDERRHDDRDERDRRYADRERDERRYRDIDEREQRYARREREERNIEVEKTDNIEIKPELTAAVPIINKEETVIEEKHETEIVQTSDNEKEIISETSNDVQDNIEEKEPEDISVDTLWFEKYPEDGPDEKTKSSLLFDEYTFKIEKNDELEYIRVIVYPLYYCYDEHISTSVLVGMESDSICRAFISEGDTKNIKANFNDDNFIIRGKWVDGKFNSQVYYNKKKSEDKVSFEKTEYRPEEPTQSTHLIISRLTDKVHIFPLTLANDSRSGLALAVAYSEEENTLLTPMKNGQLPLSKKDNCINQTYWKDNNRIFVCRE